MVGTIWTLYSCANLHTFRHYKTDLFWQSYVSKCIKTILTLGRKMAENLSDVISAISFMQS